MRSRRLALVMLVTLTRVAAAQTDQDKTDVIAMGGDYTFETWPLELSRRPLLLAPGMIELGADLGVNLSKSSVGRPLTLANRATWGASDHFTLFAANDPGLCLGARSVCPHYEGGLAAGTLVGLLGNAGAPLQIGGQVDLHIETFSPFALGVRLGAPVRVLLGRIALELDARFTIALSGPDPRKRERLELPFELQAQLSGRLALLFDTGFAGPVSSLSSERVVPVALGLSDTLSRCLDVGGRFGFPNLLGKGGTADARSLEFFVKYRR